LFGYRNQLPANHSTAHVARIDDLFVDVENDSGGRILEVTAAAQARPGVSFQPRGDFAKSAATPCAGWAASSSSRRDTETAR
jgi:hypothetical protein